MSEELDYNDDALALKVAKNLFEAKWPGQSTKIVSAKWTSPNTLDVQMVPPKWADDVQINIIVTSKGTLPVPA